MTDFVKIQDELAETRQLVEVAFMACADVEQKQGSALCTMLNVVSERLVEIGEAIDTLWRSRAS